MSERRIWTNDEILNERPNVSEVLDLELRCGALLANRHPHVQLAALAGMLACWLASNQPVDDTEEAARATEAARKMHPRILPHPGRPHAARRDQAPRRDHEAAAGPAMKAPVPQEVWDYIERHGDTRALAQMEVDPVGSRGSPELLAHLRSRRPPLNELEIRWSCAGPTGRRRTMSTTSTGATRCRATAAPPAAAAARASRCAPDGTMTRSPMATRTSPSSNTRTGGSPSA